MDDFIEGLKTFIPFEYSIKDTENTNSSFIPKEGEY